MFDITVPKTEITEHIVQSKECPNCLHINKGKFPDEVIAPVQYGAKIQAVAMYMMHGHLSMSTYIRALAKQPAKIELAFVSKLLVGNAWDFGCQFVL